MVSFMKRLYGLSSHIISNLEFDTLYKINVIAIDDKNKEIKTPVTNVKTLNKLYLYKQGDNYEELTQGWTYTGYHSKPGGSYSNDQNGIYLASSYGVRIFYGIQKMINLTAYSKLYIVSEGTDKICQISKRSYHNNATGSDIGYSNNAIDISGYKDEYYIHLTVANGDTVRVKEVYLEK